MYSVLRRALFRLDPEDAHDIATAQMMRLQDIAMARRLIARAFRSREHRVELWGLRFPNPVGIAAGFDKNARMVPMLSALGFGFIEVGTVTLRPQSGNPRPRLFRIAESQALINRLGFNNEGAEVVAERLRTLWSLSDQNEWRPLLVNIGKNRDAPIEAAAENYEQSYRLLGPVADGVVLNVSSPNTPGLRDLQSPEQLRPILELVREVRWKSEFLRGGDHPILVKIAPDLDAAQLAGIAELCRELADGIIATNTTLSRDGLASPVAEAGGLSGRPLFERSTDVLRTLRGLLGPDYPLIGVGGIFSAQDAIAKISAGANLVQAYTGFVYEGPGFASRINARLKNE
ncbi:MAG TPA: quinone-dependent dihydroorotate dehydrogenase [Thermoanaerobaculia bacterium]|nr:quinone-dependent dihydroorotate dehydrogenase [Thermoanaerobaculia bacterium]